MVDDSDHGAFSADIPEAAIADALAAVEGGASGDEVPIEVEAPEATGQPAPGEVDRLRVALEESQQRARQVFQQLKDEHDRLLRTAADLENYKKRAARERDEVQRYGIERLVKELLPVLDNLGRALAAAPADDALAGGVELTRRTFEEALARFGVRGFSAAGERFDPRVHEALMTVTTDAVLPGLVVEEQQRGYFLHDRLIRPAAVVVAAAPMPGAQVAADEALEVEGRQGDDDG